MGIDTKHRKGMRDNVATKAFSTTITPLAHEVVIEDCLIRVKEFSGYGGQHIITALQFFEFLWKPIEAELVHNATVQVYVMCMDDKRSVTAKGMKGRTHTLRAEASARQIVNHNRLVAEQKERMSKTTPTPPAPKAASAVEQQLRAVVEQEEAQQERNEEKILQLDMSDQPYPSQYYLTDDMMILPDGEELRDFDLRRLLAGNRVPLWEYVNRKLQQKKSIPANKLVILEWTASGPWFHTTDTHVHRTDVAHNHGEYDTSMQFWMWFFSDKPVRIKTVDTDVIPLVNMYLNETPVAEQNPAIRWVYKNQEFKPVAAFGETKAAEFVVDMKLYRTLVTRHLRIPAHLYVLGCILSGTDFFFKADIFDGFGWRHVFEGLRALWEHSKEHGPLGTEKLLTLLYRFMCSVFIYESGTAELNRMIKNNEWNGPVPVNIDERTVLYPNEDHERNAMRLMDDKDILIRKVARMQVDFPTRECIANAAVDVARNISYWKDDWKSGTEREDVRAAKEEIQKTLRVSNVPRLKTSIPHSCLSMFLKK